MEETQRDAIVKRITHNKWGLSADGKTVTGPEGFTIDVSKCAVGWNNLEGLTDRDIKIGQTIAQSVRSGFTVISLSVCRPISMR